MNKSFSNQYKLFRSGYLTEGNLVKKITKELDWLLNQLEDEVKVELLKFRPQLIHEFEQEIFRANDFQFNRYYGKCQKSLKQCHQLLVEIKNTLRVVDWYKDTNKTYKKIEKDILIHPSIRLPSIKLFKHYLNKIREEIKKGKLKKARLFLSLGSEEIKDSLNTQEVNKIKQKYLKSKGIELVELVRTTSFWAKKIPASLQLITFEEVIAIVHIFIEEHKYVFAEKILDDLAIQINPRKSFLEEWERTKRLFPQEANQVKKELLSNLKIKGWFWATDFLLSKTSTHITFQIKNIKLH